MGTIRPFHSPIQPFEALDDLVTASPQLFMMPVPQPPIEDDLPYPVEGKGGKLIYMPARWNALAAASKSRRQYHGNAVECWPKGYPTHDDL